MAGSRPTRSCRSRSVCYRSSDKAETLSTFITVGEELEEGVFEVERVISRRKKAVITVRSL